MWLYPKSSCFNILYIVSLDGKFVNDEIYLGQADWERLLIIGLSELEWEIVTPTLLFNCSIGLLDVRCIVLTSLLVDD